MATKPALDLFRAAAAQMRELAGHVEYGRLLRAHEMMMVPGADEALWPGGEEPWCVRCDATWPCDVVADAMLWYWRGTS